MLARQKQVIETYQRVQDFLAAYPPPESAGYTAQKTVLDDVVAKLSSHSTDQVAGRRLSKAEGKRQLSLRAKLRKQHMAPIAQIARATLRDEPGIEKALKMPSYSLGPTRLLAEATAMRKAVDGYQSRFVDGGRPADFLEQLDAAAEAVRLSVLIKARSVGEHVGARAGMQKEIRRGRKAVELLDTIVRTAFSTDSDVLAKWRSAKRVKAVTGGSVPVAGITADENVPETAPAAA